MRSTGEGSDGGPRPLFKLSCDFMKFYSYHFLEIKVLFIFFPLSPSLPCLQIVNLDLRMSVKVVYRGYGKNNLVK